VVAFVCMFLEYLKYISGGETKVFEFIVYILYSGGVVEVPVFLITTLNGLSCLIWYGTGHYCLVSLYRHSAYILWLA